MRTTLKILGLVTGAILIGSLIVMNAQTVRIDLVFIDGEVALFLVIVASFLAGFITCLTYLWLKRMLYVQPVDRRPRSRHADIFEDI